MQHEQDLGSRVGLEGRRRRRARGRQAVGNPREHAPDHAAWGHPHVR